MTEPLRRRALLWHQLGPWHEVTYGADIADPEMVRSGLAGVLDRLDLTARLISALGIGECSR
ncbi:hypothetical protein [Nocardia asteroides]|uniref:hypothetical protein n=1 Tax=Nocardia asteroides TaxID=1824 RepID=UPI0033C415D8